MPVPRPVDVPSPCTGICRIREPDGRCDGCERSLDEIAAWGTMSSRAKQALLEQVRKRLARRATCAVDRAQRNRQISEQTPQRSGSSDPRNHDG